MRLLPQLGYRPLVKIIRSSLEYVQMRTSLPSWEWLEILAHQCHSEAKSGADIIND